MPASQNYPSVGWGKKFVKRWLIWARKSGLSPIRYDFILSRILRLRPEQGNYCIPYRSNLLVYFG